MSAAGATPTARALSRLNRSGWRRQIRGRAVRCAGAARLSTGWRARTLEAETQGRRCEQDCESNALTRPQKPPNCKRFCLGGVKALISSLP